MPTKRDYGSPTRRSQRLTTASEEPEGITTQVDVNDEEATAVAVATAEGTEPEEPARLVHGDNREQDTLLPSIEEKEESEDYDSAPENNNLEEAADYLPLEQQQPNLSLFTPLAMPDDVNNLRSAMEQILRRLAQLEAREEPETQRPTRGITPSNSAFGGVDFKPTGFAALPAFKPFGADQDAKNAAFDRKARESRRDPGTFQGNKDLFDKWVIKLADKCEEDLDTFKTERSRMALVFSLTDGPANDLLEARYSSTENPFKNTPEMIATLTAVYHDDNQGSKVREKLRTLEYDLADKTMDIHQFIGTVNSLANRAGIDKAERKTVLFEHIPTDLDLHLLRDSKDPTISYEDFAGAVADAAEAKPRAYDKRVEKKQATRSNQSPTSELLRQTRRRSPRRGGLVEAKSTTFDGTLLVSERKKVDGKCFLCQKEGHMARHYPQKK